MSIISLKNIGITATDPLFSNLNFVLGAGDRVGLIAGNGGGKTTLLNCIAGLDEPSAGEIIRSRGVHIGMVEQGGPSSLMALDFVEAVCAALPLDLCQTDSWRAEVALDSFDTPQELRLRGVRALSGGWWGAFIRGMLARARCWPAPGLRWRNNRGPFLN